MEPSVVCIGKIEPSSVHALMASCHRRDVKIYAVNFLREIECCVEFDRHGKAAGRMRVGSQPINPKLIWFGAELECQGSTADQEYVSSEMASLFVSLSQALDIPVINAPQVSMQRAKSGTSCCVRSFLKNRGHAVSNNSFGFDSSSKGIYKVEGEGEDQFLVHQVGDTQRWFQVPYNSELIETQNHAIPEAIRTLDNQVSCELDEWYHVRSYAKVQDRFVFFNSARTPLPEISGGHFENLIDTIVSKALFVAEKGR